MRSAWRVVLGCFVGVSVSIAPAYMSVFGLFIKPMAAETGLSRAQLSLVPSLMALVAAVCSPFVGTLIDRWGARVVALAGATLLPLGLLAHAGLASGLGTPVILAVGMGMIAAIACPLPYVSALPHWFDRRLGLAIAVAMSGIGFGEIVLPKIAARLIASEGWRHAWVALAALLAVVGISSVVFLFRDRPDRVTQSMAATGGAFGLTWQEALRSPAFWLLGVAVCLVAQVGVGMMIHAVPMLTDRGMDAADASSAIAVLGIGSLLGRLTTGMLLDRLSISLVGGGLFLLQAIGMFMLWSGLDGVVPLAAMFLVGLAVGAETDIIPFAVRRTFGVRQFGRIFGMIYGLFSIGPVLGPVLMGLSFGSLGSYSPALLVFVGSALVAAVAIAFAGKMAPPEHQETLRA